MCGYKSGLFYIFVLFVYQCFNLSQFVFQFQIDFLHLCIGLHVADALRRQEESISSHVAKLSAVQRTRRFLRVSDPITVINNALGPPLKLGDLLFVLFYYLIHLMAFKG